MMTSINLYYTVKYDSRIITNSERRYVCLNLPKDCGKIYETSFSQLFINTMKLDSIKNSFATISFKDTPLDDNSSYKLSEVKITDNKNNVLKKFEFAYQTYKNRIFLTSLTELFDVNNKKNPYIFKYYHPDLLPDRSNYNQDYWGYYNARGNTTLVPKMFVAGEIIGGANRTTNPETVKYGVLSEIHYPTKGYIKFEFEANQCQNYEALYYDDLEYITEMVVFDDRDGAYNVFGFPYSNSKVIFTKGDQFVQITFNSSNYKNDAPYGNGQFFIKNTLTNEIVYHLSGQPLHATIYLFEGKYELIATGNIPRDYVKGTITFIPYNKIINEPDIKENYIGGVRIKNISNYDKINGKKLSERSYEYKLETDSSISSGFLVTKSLKHAYNLTELYPTSCEAQGYIFSELCYKADNYVVISSGSMNQLGSTQGSHVGYKEVTEKFGVDNGKKIYKYLSSDKYPDLTADVFPFPSPVSRDWKRGLVKEIKTFSNENKLLKKELFTYEFSENKGDVNRVVIPAGVVGYNWLCYFCANGGGASYAYEPYDIEAAWQYQKQKKTIDYFSDDSIAITENYYYDYPKNAFLNRIEKIFADGQIELNKLWYPEDLPSEGVNSNLIYYNIINRPVKTEKYLNDNFLKRNQYYYNIYGKPIRVDESYLKMGTGELLTDLVLKCQYDANQNLIGAEKRDGIKTSYVWAYNNQYPIIKILSNNPNIPINQIQTTINGINLSGSEIKARIDADIANLKNALSPYLGENYLFSIYTYKPLVGITSETDPRGQTTYYLYDVLGRLIDIRDHDYNIIKHYDYNYSDQSQ